MELTELDPDHHGSSGGDSREKPISKILISKADKKVHLESYMQAANSLQFSPGGEIFLKSYMPY